MEQNGNQDKDKIQGRRKMMFLAAGIIVILLAIFLAFLLFTDRTDASTGEGDAILIAPDRIQRISDDVSKHVLDTLSKDILADMISESAARELTKDKIYEILSEEGIEAAAIGKEELLGYITGLLEELGISGDGVFTDSQKEYIQAKVKEALEGSLANISVSQFLTEEEKQRLEEQLKKELSQTLKNQIQNSSYQLTSQELEQLKRALDLESLVSSKVQAITKQQLEKLQENMIANIKKSVRTPVKGVDYFTESDIKSIQAKILANVNKETVKQIEGLTSKINEVKTSVSTLTKQIKELSKLDKEKSANIEKLQKGITNINASIQHINSVTELLAKAIQVTGANLEKVTGSGSEIYASKVPADNLTIAQFVDILAGNGNVYTRAIQELDRIVKQLREENLKQDKEFDKSLKELEISLGDNGKELELAKAALEKSDQEIKEQLGQQYADLSKKLDSEQKEREKSDKKLKEQADKADSLIGEPKTAGEVQGDTIFQKIGSIVKILSKDGLGGMLKALQNIRGAETVSEGMENLNEDLQDARERVGELEKEKWLSDITLLAQGYQEGVSGFTYQESGSAFVYRVPLVLEGQIGLSADDTAIVVEFKQPGKLPSDVALSTSGNDLLITFTNRPTRNIKITTIHIYKER